MILKLFTFAFLMTTTINCGAVEVIFPHAFSAVAADAVKDEWKQELINIAKDAASKSYSPYSKYPVGACVLCDDGFCYRGCNVENASYGLTCCAERVALFNCIGQRQNKEDKPVVMTVVSRRGAAPCGACLQVMSEFNTDMMIILADEKGKYIEEFYLLDVMPKQFNNKDLK